MHLRRRFVLPLVAICLALAVAPALAAKPVPSLIPSPAGTPVDHQIGNVTSIPTTCQLGVVGPSIGSFGYVDPPDDVYYTLLNPANCPTCPGDKYRLTTAHLLLYFTEPCNIQVTVSVVPAVESSPGCFAPNRVPPPICPPTTYLVDDGGALEQNLDVQFAMPADCCISGPAFLVFEFDEGTCAEGRPRFLTPASCNNCTQYNVYPLKPSGDDLCAVLSPNLHGPIMYADAECCPVNQPPDCSGATASEAVLWPPNHKYHGISIDGVTDPDGDPVAITVTGITQDEPVNGRGDGNTCPDGQIVDGQASVRAERTGTPGVPGNGRVYGISFTADDGKGGVCQGTVNVCVPHDKNDPTCFDDGQQYNSVLNDCRSGNSLAPEALSLGVAQITESQAELTFALPVDSHVDISVFDVTGRRLATIEDAQLTSGVYQRVWNMVGVAKGLYFVRMHVGAETLTQRVVKTH
jgi:hypothetical protein